MNLKKQQFKVIHIFLFATPVICLLLGILGRAISDHELNDDGTDWSMVLPWLGFILGLTGSAIGLALGVLTAFLTQRSKLQSYVQYAYLLPASIAILYMLYILVLNG